MQSLFSGTNALKNTFGEHQKAHIHKIELQERLIEHKLSEIVLHIEQLLEDLDNDTSETLEIQLGEIQIYVDVATRGWDYRSIELVAVDIINAQCDALTRSARKLYNILTDRTHKLNQQMDNLYASRDY